MREDTNEVSANEMLLIFESNPVNEGLARVTAASFCTQLNPTLEEIADLKTAVSEAVTNCIIHGYEGRRGRIEMHLSYRERELYVDITDHGMILWPSQLDGAHQSSVSLMALETRESTWPTSKRHVATQLTTRRYYSANSQDL